MSAVKKFYKSHNIAVFLFCSLCLYSVFIGEGKIEKIGDYALSFHAVDFSMGFASKIVVGQIYNLFFDSVTQRNAMLLEILFLVVFFIIVSFLLENFIRKTDAEHRKNIFIGVILLLIGPCTFSLITKTIGMLDTYWLFSCALFFVFLSRKKLYFLIIPLIIVTIMIHFATIFNYAPFYIIIMLYKISCCENKKERNYLWIITVVAAVAAVALALYFMVFEQSNMVYTYEEFKDFMASRGITDTLYYDYAFYRAPEANASDYEELIQYQNISGNAAKDLISLITMQVKLALDSIYFGNDILPFVLLSPIIYFVYYFRFIIFKQNKENKVKRFSLFCMSVLFFMTYFVGKITSYDNLRWIIHSYIPLILSLLYILYIEKEKAIAVFSGIIERIPKKILATYILIYGIVVLEPYM